MLSGTIKLLGICLLLYICSQANAQSGDFYQIRIYHLADLRQQAETDAYLKLAYVPALHRAGITKVGVFKPVETDTVLFGKRIYVLVPYTSLKQVTDLDARLQKDDAYQTAAASYLNAVYNNAPYNRFESILTKAFPDALHFQIPALKGPVAERVYELRSYESPTEKIFANKVKMFNEGGEIILFRKLEFNAVFYSEVVAGGAMPNLMYMTSFNNMAARDEHWKSFVASPEWKTLSTAPEYQHNVSKIEIFLLHPTDYSDI